MFQLCAAVRTHFRRIGRSGRHEQPESDDGTVDPLLTFFRWRDWTILDRSSDTSANLYYSASLQGALDTDNRRLTPLDANLSELECELAHDGTYWIASFFSCGTVIGCGQHRSTQVVIGVHSGVFPSVLDQLEHQARILDPEEIATCVVFGPCGSDSNPTSNTGGPRWHRLRLPRCVVSPCAARRTAR
ncbi:hypothetical protein BS329_03985 [Amycolatopsis coloradensis]|uniref:Uncharacterized protein n=1 Tax=Amycolatopsis coloradensis TaxID=76021 RepID=A0A1R0KZX5_9PSEU|nr:hypothetical protein [Amycolatopsis coloradensis]OLZ55192.1 hypothetical protein BS329_03985 [Amycolatopsis coloradensis]